MTIFNSMVMPNLDEHPRRCHSNKSSGGRCGINTDNVALTGPARSLHRGTFTCLYHLKNEHLFNGGFRIDQVHSKLEISKWYCGTHLSADYWKS